jgi:hypothetical protein
MMIPRCDECGKAFRLVCICGCDGCPQCNELRRALEIQIKTTGDLTRQVARLGRCVECGELDEQDGVRRNGEFRCVGCEFQFKEPGGE